MVSLLNNSVTSPKQYHRCWLVLKKEGSFDTIKSFCVYKYKVQGLNLFNLSLNQFSPPVKYRQCCHSEAHGCRGPVHATLGLWTGGTPRRGDIWRRVCKQMLRDSQSHPTFAEKGHTETWPPPVPHRELNYSCDYRASTCKLCGPANSWRTRS